MVIKILEELIQFKTVTTNYDLNLQALRWIETQLQKKKYFFTYFKENNHSSLIITTQRTKTPKVLLQGHMDVVPAPDEMFTPRQRNGKLFGRGAYDMKFALACFVLLLKELEDEKKYSLGVMITTDEEIGGREGAKKLVAQGFGASKICFLPDGGEDWNFEMWAKGIYQLKVIATGKTSHASRPWLGENAILKLMKAIDDIQHVFVQEPCGDPLHQHPTMSLSTIMGGTAINQVPDNAEAMFDVRYLPITDTTKIKKDIEKVLKKHDGVRLEEFSLGSSYSTELAQHEQSVFADIAKKYGKKVEGTFSHGSSDAKFFIQKGIPTMLVRPKGGHLHADGEWIDIKDLETFYIVLKEFVLKQAV